MTISNYQPYPLLSPVITTQEGLTLTAQNWQQAGISVITWRLTDLLVKPGIAGLRHINDLASWFGWQGNVLLNAMLPYPKKKDDTYELLSPYNGQRIRITWDEVFELIIMIAPDYVLMPYETIWKTPQHWQKALSPECLPILHHKHLDEMCLTLNEPYGVYYEELSGLKLSKFKKCLNVLVSDTLNPGKDIDLQENGLQSLDIIVSNKPADDACNGKLYTQNGVLSLTESSYSQQFSVIDASCNCPTCSQQFTLAYLHHLYQHTPLLCQRYLVMHNAYFSATMLTV